MQFASFLFTRASAQQRRNNPCEVSGYELFYVYRIKESPLICNAKYGLDLRGRLNTALSSKHDERIIISL